MFHLFLHLSASATNIGSQVSVLRLVLSVFALLILFLPLWVGVELRPGNKKVSYRRMAAETNEK